MPCLNLYSVHLDHLCSTKRNKMETTYQQAISASYSEKASRPSVISNFLNWCKAQQNDRLLWLGIALAGHGCVITPITIMAVVFAGTNLVLFILAIVAMAI